MSNSLRTQPLTPMPAAAPACGVGLGQVLALRYQLDAVLGWGGQAVVFAATDLQQRGNPARLAVKVARTDLPPTAHQEAVAVLRWEARMLRRLKHPALPRMLRLQSDSTATWFARDMIEGRPLATLSAHGPCAPQLVQHWAVQICDLLRYLHSQSPPVICGDLKPANLILRADGSLALIDMGAALTRTRRPPRRPRPRYGTPGYAPPEQMGNWGNDERSDLFSLAVICYELLLGSDPTAAPLQFDLARLDALAPTLAPALRWALALDPARRTPTAATFRSALVPPIPVEPLKLGYGISVVARRDLLDIAVRHPQLLENALKSGAVERWLGQHPDRQMGALLHDLRVAQRSASSRQRPLDIFFSALAPSDGSPLLRVTPDRLRFGVIPLRHWRIWSRPQLLTLHNSAGHPLRWELECPSQGDAEVRLLLDGRAMRRHEGVLPPGGKAKIELVAAGKLGQRQGQLTLRCGTHVTTIPWEASAAAGLAVGQQFVTRLSDLDLSRPDLIPALEDLLRRGVLVRWLRAQGERHFAAELAVATHQVPLDEMTARLLVARVLHHIDPLRFPWLQVQGHSPANKELASGSVAQYSLLVANRGSHPCLLAWRSACSWARIDSTASVVPPGGQLPAVVTVAPPANLSPGVQPVALEIQTAHISIPVQLILDITEERWWQRALRWIRGR